MSQKARRARAPMRRASVRPRLSGTTPRDRTVTALRAERDLALERAGRRSEFISHASHEIRTPLHGILGFATLLLGTELTDEQRAFANSLHASIESLLAVVNDVLDVSTLDAGAMRLDSEGFNLIALIRGVADTFSEAAAAKGLALRVDADDVKHPTVIGDPGRIRQILTNLVSNAVKFTDTGHVAVRAVTRSTTRGAVEMCVSVSDTGPGIPRDAQARLFQPFSRLRQPGVAGKPGTGLGLSISRQLVELMGGSIDFDSSAKRGTTFSVTVALKEDARPMALREMERLDVAKLRVYVADDDSRSLSELLISLAAAGVGVVGTGSAVALPEALRKAKTGGNRPDVAIIGHVRRESGELAIAKAVRADPRLAGVQLVLAPVSGVRGQARDARDAGYDAYVPRPFRGTELLQCLRAVIVRAQGGPIDHPRLITRYNVAGHTDLPAAGRVLVADDEPASRQVTRLQIARLGYPVDEVAGGADAVAAAATGAYRLILMDCQMPDMDGLTAAAAIRRQEEPTQRAFIVALTADVSAEQRERCRDAGMDEFLEKPLRTQTLASLLNRHVRRGHESIASAANGSEPGNADSVATIEQLGAEIGPEMTLELVREYLVGAKRAIERLSGPESLDVGGVRSVAHRLLGGARVLGLAQFEQIWGPLSREDATDPTVPPATLDALHGACADLAAWIDSQQRKQHA
jgi:two-component system, sensor histidine kinase and response regulator